MSNRAALRATGAFGEFTDHDLDVLVSASEPRRYTPGQIVCREGSIGTSCFCIVNGSLEVVKQTPEGEKVVATLGPGAIAGQVALVQRVPRIATLRARVEVTAQEFSRDTFERLLQANSPLALRFQRQIAVAGIRQLRGALKRMADVMGRHSPSVPPPRAAGAPAQPPPSRDDGERISTVDALEFIQNAARDWDVSLDQLDRVEIVASPMVPQRRPPMGR